MTIRYAVTITTVDPQALVNVAELGEAGQAFSIATAVVIANPYEVHLPLILKNG